MSDISGFDPRASIAQVLRANRVSSPETSGATRATPSDTPNQAVRLPPPQPFRLASDPGPAVFRVELDGAENDTTEVREALSGELGKLYEVFQGRGRAGPVVEEALAALKPLIDSAAVEGAERIEIRLANVTRVFGGDGTESPATGGVSAFAIEVGLVRGARVAAEDVRVLSVSGAVVDLTAEQRETGVSSGVYRIQDEALSSPELEAARGANKAQVQAIQNALDRLRLVQDALASYRNGDDRALEEVERFFRSGTLDAGAVRAISDVRSPSEAVVPGTGVVGLS